MTHFLGDIHLRDFWGRTLFLTALLCLAFPWSSRAQDQASPTLTPGDSSPEGDKDNPSSTPADLSKMSLEKLADLDVQVTSSAKKPESLRDATSAIYVITSEDIRRSGARDLPDLLAMVPGVQVARQSANEWAISARGFNAQYNNKMLVLVDGLSVYDPVFGGVQWNELDVFLPDVDRIEAIRGPGGTLWGSNAVNGIVNIITKDAKDTQGTYFSSLGGLNIYPSGTTDPRIVNSRLQARVGGQSSDNFYYRFYGKLSSQGPSVNPQADIYETALDSSTWNDASYDFQVGSRLDWHTESDQVTLEAGAQKGYFEYARLTTAVDPVFDPDVFVTGNDINTQVDQNAHIILRWTRDFADGSQLQALGTYYYHNITTLNDDSINNLGQAEIQFQHRFPLGPWNEVTYGGNFRNYSDQFLNPVNEYFTPVNQVLNIYGGYLQDRLTLVDGRLFLTGGVKLENNSYTGNEWQPSGRILFTPDDKNSLWGAVSKAVRIPVEVGRTADIYFTGIPANYYGAGNPAVNTYGAFVPNPNLGSETLISYELGYRTNPTKDSSIDLATFYNHYEGLFNFVPLMGQFFSPAGGVIDGSILAVQPQNGGMGDIYGAELAVQWKPLTALRVDLSYTYQDYDSGMVAASNIESGAPPPHNLVNGRVYFDPISQIELNTSAYFTDTTYLYDPLDKTHIVPSYWRWDMGAVWKPGDGVRWEIGATDLEGGHVETLPSAFVDLAQVVPSIYTSVSMEY